MILSLGNIAPRFFSYDLLFTRAASSRLTFVPVDTQALVAPFV